MEPQLISFYHKLELKQALMLLESGGTAANVSMQYVCLFVLVCLSLGVSVRISL